MNGCDLTAEQCSKLLGVVDRHRWYLEQLYARMVAVDMPTDDPTRMACRRSLIATRDLCVMFAMGLQKGELRRYKRSMDRWAEVR